MAHLALLGNVGEHAGVDLAAGQDAAGILTGGRYAVGVMTAE